MTVHQKEKKHKARQIQLERQESYFTQFMKEEIAKYHVSVANARVIMKIALLAYKRGRLDR